jgi:hypothetical protein
MRNDNANSRTNIMGDARWERLQALLLAVRPGQKVTARAVSAESGLELATVEMVLNALTKATLFRVCATSTYVRQRLELLPAPGDA